MGWILKWDEDDIYKEKKNMEMLPSNAKYICLNIVLKQHTTFTADDIKRLYQDQTNKVYDRHLFVRYLADLKREGLIKFADLQLGGVYKVV